MNDRIITGYPQRDQGDERDEPQRPDGLTAAERERLLFQRYIHADNPDEQITETAE